MILVIFSLKSWGSNTLPQLSSHQALVMERPGYDTIPVNSEPAAKANDPEQISSVQPTPSVAKQVPRSRKKLKPARVNPPVDIPAAPILKPKIVIKKITIKTP
jgi:hypothetical protein